MRKEKRDSFGKRRKRGWGMDLYRNPSESLIGGVCAGLADHWGVATWMVRLAAVALLLFTGSLAFWGYIMAWMYCRRDRRVGSTTQKRLKSRWSTMRTFIPIVNVRYSVILIRPQIGCVKPNSGLMRPWAVLNPWSAT